LKIQKIILTVWVVMLFTAGCVSTNPAGPAQYANPSYADQLKGYFYCGQEPYAAVFSNGSSVVWISEPANSRIFYRDVSRAIVNPLVCDTVVVDFAPGRMLSPPSGDCIYICGYNSNKIYALNTESLKWSRVYTNSSSISTVQLSSDGETLFLGSLGSPWHIEAVSTADWTRAASVSVEYPVSRLELSPDNSLIAAGNSGGTSIDLFDAADLSPVDTLFMPMRIGTMSFTSDSRSLVVLDAASFRPYMVKVNLATGEEEFRSRPYNSYLKNCRVTGSDVLILPRNQDERVSVLNMENMIFAPSLELSSRAGAACVSSNGDYIVAVSRTTIPGRATVFIKGD